MVVNIAKALQGETDYFLKEDDKGQTAIMLFQLQLQEKVVN